MIPGSANLLLLASAAGSPAPSYQIERSLRFNSSDSAYLNHSVTSDSNQKCTISFWIKKTKIGGTHYVCSTHPYDDAMVRFENDQLVSTFSFTSSATWRGASAPYFRDPTAWYHVVIAFDTTQAVAADRVKLYVNGSSASWSTYIDPVLNTTFRWSQYQYIGRYDTTYGDYYLAEFYTIDGQQLTADEFGEFDSSGIWQPKVYTGTFGSGGSYLPFSDNSTAAALGTDTSGNGNNWTPINLSATPSIYATNDVITASSGVVPNGGTPYWIDILPTNAHLGYNFNRLGFAHDSSLSTFTYWVGDEYTEGNVLRARLDLRQFPTVSSVRIYARTDSGGYTPYNARLLDSGKNIISGTNTSLGGTTPSWITVPVSGNPRYLEIYTSSGVFKRLYMYAIEINGVQLVNTYDFDSLVDTPTNGSQTDTGVGGEVVGNYATLNPLDITSGITLSNGNLDVAQTAGSGVVACATWGISSGKWYWEVQCPTGINSMVGIGDFSVFPTSSRYYGGSGLYYYQATGGLYGNLAHSGNNQPYGAAFQNSADIVGVALDMDSGNVNFYKNGVNQGIANTSSLLGKTVTPALNNGGAAAGNVINFGQRPFAYTAPSGFKALCTTNLPEPQTITTSGSYTGNGVADGPFVYLNGVPTAMTVNGNAVTFGTEADKLSNGFKVRTTSTTYNQNAVVYNYSITSTGDPFKRARAQSNP